MFFLSKLIIASLFVQSFIDSTVEVNGVIKDAKHKKIYLIKRGNGTSNLTSTIILDSCEIDKNGYFKLQCNVLESQFLSITIDNDSWYPFFADPGKKYFIEGDKEEIWKSKLINSDINTRLKVLDVRKRASINKNNKLVDSISKYKNTDTIKSNQFFSQYEKTRDAIKQLDFEFILANAKNPACLYILYTYALRHEITEMEFNSLSLQLGPMVKQHSLYKKIQSYYAIPNEIFSKSILTSIKKLNSETIISGKYTVLSFWASWCKPCLKSIPSLDSLYNLNNISVVGISFDASSILANKILTKYKVNWPQYIDSTGSRGVIGRIYQIDYLPLYFIIENASNKIVFRSNKIRDVINEYWLLKKDPD